MILTEATQITETPFFNYKGSIKIREDFAKIKLFLAEGTTREEEIFQRNYGDVLRKIEDIIKLPNNWDSYNAVRISNKTSDRAIRFLRELFKALNDKGKALPKPFVVPCPDGSIQFEWEKSSKGLEVIIPYSKDDRIGFLKVQGNDYEEGFVDNPEDLLEYLIWIS